MARNSRLFLYGPILVIGVLLLAWRIFWNAGADEMRSAMRRAADRMTTLGVVMTYEPLEAHGFPLSLEGLTENVVFSGPRRRAKADRLSLDISMLHLDRLRLSTDRIEVTGDGEFWTLDGDMRAFVVRDTKRGWVVRADARKIGAVRGDRLWEIGEVILESGPDEGDKARIRTAMKITDARLRGTRAVVEIAEATFDIEPNPVANGDAAPPRDVLVRGATLQFDGATLKGSGVIRVLPGGDVEGVFNGCIDKPEKLAKLAGHSGALTMEEADHAARALSLASQLTASGALCAPIAMRDGAFTIAGVAFAKY
jgi:hypothetical protein